jgi:hypothetical protein
MKKKKSLICQYEDVENLDFHSCEMLIFLQNIWFGQQYFSSCVRIGLSIYVQLINEGFCYVGS